MRSITARPSTGPLIVDATRVRYTRSMRNSWLVAIVLVGCSGSAHDDKVYVSIGTDALATAGPHAQLVETDGDVAVIEVNARDVEELSQHMHEQHHRCGGFIVHDSLDDAHAALHPHAAPTLDYSLDRAAAVRAVLPELDASRILGTIRELSNMRNRYYLSESGAAASLWLRDKWRGFTSRSDVTVELFDQGYPQKSVILTIPGSTHPDEVVVLGGHLDSIGLGGKTANAPGADDDASGIATLTEIARVLLAKDFRPTRTIKIMAYGAEEVGLRGSQAIVRDYKKRKVNVIGALQLDMTNYQGSDRDIWVIDDFTSKAQNQFLVQLIETYTGATWGSDVCGYACSDHASWTRAGVPASMPFESRSRDRNNKIHSPKDTLELSNNNAEHAVKFARLGAAYAIELAKGDLASATITKTEDERSSSWPWLALALAAGLGLGWTALRRSA